MLLHNDTFSENFQVLEKREGFVDNSIISF